LGVLAMAVFRRAAGSPGRLRKEGVMTAVYMIVVFIVLMAVLNFFEKGRID